MPIQDTRYLPPTPDQIEELTAAVIALGDHVRHLRHAVDEIEQELGWAIRTKVLDRLPRPEFPCDERLELVDDEPESQSHQRSKHARDLANDPYYPHQDQQPTSPALSAADSMPTSPRNKQPKLW